MPTFRFPTISSIITWANENALIYDVQFFRGSRDLPYIFKDNLYHYFKRQGLYFELLMTSERDLESFR